MDKRLDALQRAVTVLSARGSIELFGDHGSGRSTFISRVVEHFRNQNWRVLVVHGNEAFRKTPLVALALAGVKTAASGRISAIPEILTEIRDRIAGEDALIVIDDADFIDDASWGVLLALRSEGELPILQSRQPGSHRRWPGGQAETVISLPGFGLELGPVRFEDLSEIIAQKLGNPISPNAMSQVFGVAGGNIGLSIAVATAAVQEGRMELQGGEWTTTGHLWSDSLTPYIDASLAQLSSDEWDGLEMLSLLGVVDADTFSELTDWDVLVKLEERALVELYPSGGRLLVSVKPPLLVDFFRNRQAAARRYRLSTMLAERLSDGNSATASFRLPEVSASPDAPFVRLVHEHLRNRLLVARAEWSRSPGKDTAANLIQLLIWSGGESDEIDAVFRASEVLPDESESAAVRWQLMRAEFMIYFEGAYEQAITLLHEAEPRYPRLGTLLRARAFELSGSLLRPSAEEELPDPDASTFDPPVNAALHLAHGTGRLIRGNPDEAGDHFRAAEHYTGAARVLGQVALNVLADYFGDHPERARTTAARGFDEAKNSLSIIDIRGYGYLVALIGVLDGRTKAVEEIIRMIFSLGDPVRQPPFVHQSFLVIGTVLAARRGDQAGALALRTRLDAVGTPDSPVPGGTQSWATAQMVASAGDPAQAADIAEAGADALWKRGANLSAAFSDLMAIEFDPTPARLARLEERIATVSAPYILDLLAYLRGVVQQDAAVLRRAAEQLAAGGRFGHALAALTRAAELAAAADDGEQAAQDLVRRAELLEGLSPDEFQETAVNTIVPQFTAREQQIASRALAGRSNQQIADELILSVRTVESHMHRIMRKAGVDRRADLSSVVQLRDLRPEHSESA